MFGTTNIDRNSVKEKSVYSEYRIKFDNAGSWNFDNESAVIFGVDNSLSSHADNRKNNLLVLGKGSTYGINGSGDSAVKNFSISFSKANTKFCLSVHYNANLLMWKKSLSSKPTIKMLTFQLNFVLEVYLMN